MPALLGVVEPLQHRPCPCGRWAPYRIIRWLLVGQGGARAEGRTFHAVAHRTPAGSVCTRAPTPGLPSVHTFQHNPHARPQLGQHASESP